MIARNTSTCSLLLNLFRPHHSITVNFTFDFTDRQQQLCEAARGLELDAVSSVLIHERFGYGCTGICTAMLANLLAETPLILAASDEIKKSYAITESCAGSDVSATRTYSKKGNEYVINGSKMWITNGGVADWFSYLHEMIMIQKHLLAKPSRHS
ncbi:putative medium-chain specific acyl-CoA dehydrogenase, mitochondrial [Dirofilaria immitis]|nr:putative medium-chain specific acyl-CoA dehydrogenase, mitochondrial [Dirofilaria immitis]